VEWQSWVFLLILCEVYESGWQSAPTLGETMARVRGFLRHRPLRFFMMHPSFWLMLFIATKLQWQNTWVDLLVAAKAVDIVLKINFAKRLEEHDLSTEMVATLTTPIPRWMPWLNVLIYPGMLAYATMQGGGM